MKTPKPPISKHYSKTTKRAALLAACATFACGMLACCMPPYAHAMQTLAFNLGYDAQTRAFAPSSSTEFLASSEPLLPGDTVTSRLILSSQNETLHAVYLKAETAVETPEQTQALIRAFEPHGFRRNGECAVLRNPWRNRTPRYSAGYEESRARAYKLERIALRTASCG